MDWYIYNSRRSWMEMYPGLHTVAYWIVNLHLTNTHNFHNILKDLSVSQNSRNICWKYCLLKEISSGTYTVIWHRVWCSRRSVLLWSAGCPFLREQGSCLLPFKVRTQVIYQLTICSLKMPFNITYTCPSQYTKCSHFERFPHRY
jgi:hypothetical protein